jgi:hypothetical protein
MFYHNKALMTLNCLTFTLLEPHTKTRCNIKKDYLEEVRGS